MDMKKSLKYLVAVAVAGNACMNVTKYMHRLFLAASLLLGIASPWHLLWGSGLEMSVNSVLNNDVIKKLRETHLFILISSHKQYLMAPYIIECMEANVKRLEQFGVTVKILVRCDPWASQEGEDDLDDYASYLDKLKIAFKVHSCSRILSRVFNSQYCKAEGAHWELATNEKNLGCSGTRHASIDAIEKEVMDLKKQGKYVYIGIFDGDDFIHPDFYLLLTANALWHGDDTTVSSYNGGCGAHGLEDPGCFMPFDEPFFGSSRKDAKFDVYAYSFRWQSSNDPYWALYSNKTAIAKNADHRRTVGGGCCTTRIFEGNYFYKKLNSEIISGRSRTMVGLSMLSVFEPFNEKAITCTTKQSLFFYNWREDRLRFDWGFDILYRLRYKNNFEDDNEETPDKVPDYRTYFKMDGTK